MRGLDVNEKTIEYYNNHAREYIIRTGRLSMSSSYQPFLEHVVRGGHILDAGCGSGRDAKFFSDNGYSVTALDGAIEMVKAARAFTGLDVEHKTFSEISAVEVYDGIWTSACLLHVPSEDWPKIYEILYRALKPGGVWFMSYKWGEGAEFQGERYFQFLNEEELIKNLEPLEGASLLEMWTEDKENGKWLQAIVKKPLGSSII